MASIKVNITFLNAQQFIERLNNSKNAEFVLRPMVFGVIDKMTKRIHIDGNKANGSPIGTYSDAYMKRRVRKPYNRTADTNIVFSLTSKLETDWNVVDTDRGYGVGFITKRSNDLVAILKRKYPGVFILSPDEREYATKRIKELVQNKLNEK